jgi:hypothetical protein
MRNNPIIPTERQIRVFNSLFNDKKNSSTIFIKEQYTLGNIFLNEFKGIEMCNPSYMTGFDAGNTEIRKRHRNNISAALRKEGYACHFYQNLGYHPKEKMQNPDFLLKTVRSSLLEFENTRCVLIEKVGRDLEKTDLFQSLLRTFKDIQERI